MERYCGKGTVERYCGHPDCTRRPTKFVEIHGAYQGPGVDADMGFACCDEHVSEFDPDTVDVSEYTGQRTYCVKTVYR